MNNFYIPSIDTIVQNTCKYTLNFKEIIENANGIHPIDIINSVQRLYEQELISADVYTQILKSAKEIPPLENENYLKTLPVPHQVDFDWRFSNNGIKYFVDFINSKVENSSKKTRIAFIGSPSLFRFFCTNVTNCDAVYLIDFNAKKHIGNFNIPAYAHVLDCNLHYNIDPKYEIENTLADIVVMDPPWYPEYYEKFFEIADVISGNQCIVIGVAPPILTRQTINQERADINAYIEALGFHNLQYTENCIEYYTPPFERNVLKSYGINNYSNCWRKGDFFFTERIEKKKIEQTNTMLLSSGGGWTEKDIGLVRFKIRNTEKRGDEDFEIKLISLYKTDIYPSVSRRFKGSNNINIWTSGNRVFHCTNVPVLFMILDYFYETDIVNIIEKEYNVKIALLHKNEIEQVIKKLKQIVELENKEYGVWIK